MNRPLLSPGDEALALLQVDPKTEVDESRVIRRNILRIWSAFKLRWWVPFLTTALLLGIYATYKLVRPPEYRAYGLVQLGMYADLTGNQQRDWAPARGAAFETHRRLLTSHSVVEDAIRRSGRQLAQGPARREQRERFLERIEIKPVRATYLVMVTAKGQDPRQVVSDANGLLDAFLPFTNEFLSSKFRVQEKLQREKEAKVLERLETARKKQQEVFERLGSTQFKEKRANLLLTQKDFQARLTLLRIERATTAAERERLARLERDIKKPEIDVERLARRLRANSETLTERQKIVSLLQTQLIQLSTTVSEDHPQAVDAKRKLAAARKSFRQDLAKVAQALLDSATDRERTQESEETKLRELLQEIEDQLSTLDRQEGQVSSVRRAVEWYDQELEATRATLRQLQSLARGDHGGAVIVNRAEVPMAAEARFKIVTFAFLSLVTFGLGLLLVVAWDHLDDSVSREDKVAHMGLPVLGRVPRLDFRDVDELAHLTGSGWLSEACSLIRTNLSVASGGLHKRAILVTSGTGGEGKSLISASLAASLVATGSRTLLIEADMRAPRLQEIFGSAHIRGLADVLGGRADLDGMVQPTAIERLDLLPAGACPRNPADLLLRGQFEQLLTTALETYDHVVVDAPPAQPLADTSLLATAAHGVVHVARLRTSRRSMLQRGIEQIDAVGGRNLGLIMNAVPASSALATSDYYIPAPLTRADAPEGASSDVAAQSDEGKVELPSPLFVVGSLRLDEEEEETSNMGVRLLLIVVLLLALGIPSVLLIAGWQRALPVDLQQSYDELLRGAEPAKK